MRRLICIGLSIIAGLVFIIEPAEPKSFSAPNLSGRKISGEGEDIQADQMLDTISFVLEHYKLDNGMYPTTAQGLKALVTRPTVPPLPPNWRGPYLGRVPVGAGGRPYHYLCPGVIRKNGYDLTVSGYEPGVVNATSTNGSITNQSDLTQTNK